MIHQVQHGGAPADTKGDPVPAAHLAPAPAPAEEKEATRAAKNAAPGYIHPTLPCPGQGFFPPPTRSIPPSHPVLSQTWDLRRQACLTQSLPQFTFQVQQRTAMKGILGTAAAPRGNLQTTRALGGEALATGGGPVVRAQWVGRRPGMQNWVL